MVRWFLASLFLSFFSVSSWAADIQCPQTLSITYSELDLQYRSPYETVRQHVLRQTLKTLQYLEENFEITLRLSLSQQTAEQCRYLGKTPKELFEAQVDRISSGDKYVYFFKANYRRPERFSSVELIIHSDLGSVSADGIEFADYGVHLVMAPYEDEGGRQRELYVAQAKSAKVH